MTAPERFADGSALPRRERAVAALPDAVHAFVSAHPANVQWLTGVRSTNAAVLVDRSGRVALATDPRYLDAAAERSVGVDVVAADDPLAALVREAASSGAAGGVGVDGGRVPWRVLNGLTEAGGAALWTDVADPVALARRTKDADEVDVIRRACALTDDVLEAVWTTLRVDESEQQVAHRLTTLLLEAGADDVAYPPIVAFGENAAFAHHVPGPRGLRRGDLVLIDVGARIDGYCSDMTRTVAFGDPGPVARRLHAAVVEAQAQARSVVAPRERADAVHERAVAVLSAAGLEHDLRHRTGHGVGLDLHEAPILGAGTSDTLGASFTVTVEPGAYRPGVGGVRVEDLMLIGTVGAESLTRLPRDLLVL